MPGGGRLVRSRASGPAARSNSTAVSATVVASAKFTAFCAKRVTPNVGTRPYVGLSPGRPHELPGPRMEPPPSLAVPNGSAPALTAAAVPPLDPPGVRAGFQGLRVTPVSGLAVYPHAPNSGVAVLPIGIAPAARNRATWRSSRVAGPASAYQFDPRRVGMPAQSSRSFTPNGTPASGGSSAPARRAASTRSAAASAPSASRCTKAFSRSCSASTLSRQVDTSSRADTSPRRTRSAASSALGIGERSAMWSSPGSVPRTIPPQAAPPPSLRGHGAEVSARRSAVPP